MYIGFVFSTEVIEGAAQGGDPITQRPDFIGIARPDTPPA
jgi:hypothetical protein